MADKKKSKSSDKKMVTIAKGKKMPKQKVEKLRKQGETTLGKYPNVAPDDFAGKVGTYPINTKERAKAALKLAHDAANPDKVKKDVYKKYPSLKKDKKSKKKS